MHTNEELVEHALKAREMAYVPYSKFPVGAALVTESGEIIYGCNVENASFGLSNCAERTAIFKALSDGKTKFNAIAVVGDTARPLTPCGACRQVLVELCPPNMKVILSNTKKDYTLTTVADLLPGAFLQEDLDEENRI